MAELDEKRLAFGSVAEQYDRARPSYPEAIIATFIAELEGGPAGVTLEVGAGTGKATVLLAEQGLRVIALEPDPRMARLARASCAGFPHVSVETIDFERWSGPEVAAIVSAQAWHWVDAATRYDIAASHLVEGGLLAAIWTLPEWDRIELRDELRGIYARRVPHLKAHFPMHPASAATTIAGAWKSEIDASISFSEPRTVEHVWERAYTAREYTDMISTHQDHVLLEAETRDALMRDVERAIAEAGGTILVTYCTRLCLARRGRPAS